MHRLLLLALWTAGPPTLPDEAPALSLRWAGPSECMGREQALGRLRELLPSVPESVAETGGRQAVEVEFVTTQAGETATRVRFHGERGDDERRFAGPSCASAAAAALLVIAVTIDPVMAAETIATALAEPEAPEPEVPEPEAPEPEAPELEPEPAPIPTPVHTLEPARVRRTSRRGEGPRVRDDDERWRVRGGVAALGGGGYGPLRAGSGMLALELAAHGPWWRSSLRGAWLPARRLGLDASVGRYDAWLLGLRGCVVPPLPRGRVELPICVGVEAGEARGRGVGATPDPRSASVPFVALALGPGLRYVPRRWLALALDLELVAALVRGGFTIGDTVAQEFAPLGVRVLAGVELRFP